MPNCIVFDEVSGDPTVSHEVAKISITTIGGHGRGQTCSLEGQVNVKERSLSSNQDNTAG
jgi:hypothetical protein